MSSDSPSNHASNDLINKLGDGIPSTPSPLQSPLPASVHPSEYGSTTNSTANVETQAGLRASDLSPSPFPDNEDNEEDEWAAPSRGTMYLIWLTLIMAGIQISWSVELAYISPYLLSLGLPKSTLSLVWIAGPVSGVIVQPLIGMMSDRSKFKWGRRRIFIVVSTIGVVLGFIGMGRTKSIIRWWTGRSDWESTRQAVIVLAVISLIILDLAINASTCALWRFTNS
jgi:MFS/sugar transport protein